MQKSGPSNGDFSLFLFLGVLVILTKIFIVKGSINLIAVLYNFEDRVFVKIINK